MAVKTNNPTARKRQGNKKSRSLIKNNFENSGVRLASISIKNYKAFEDLNLDFPAPRFREDPDIFVLGSRNGLGKTSALEACALTMATSTFYSHEFIERSREIFLDQQSALIRANQDKARIDAVFFVAGNNEKAFLYLDKEFIIDGGFEGLQNDESFLQKHGIGKPVPPSALKSLYYSILGYDHNPFILPPFLFFPSYRKTLEGGLAPGEVYGTKDQKNLFARGSEKFSGSSLFKKTVARLITTKGGAFENGEAGEAELELEELNKLIGRFADGELWKLGDSSESIDLRFAPSGGGPSFSFDGLSSGQKEIISTLFLIWRSTRKAPGVVLIDEPELHLNADWQHEFVRALMEMAPRNQYILATHSEVIFASVPLERRIMLKSD